MSLMYSNMTRSGPLRGRIAPSQHQRIASRYAKFRVPPTSESVFGKIGERYYARFGKSIDTVRRDFPEPSPFIPQWKPSDEQQARRMQGTPLERILVSPESIGGANARPGAPAANTFSYVPNFQPEWVDDRKWGSKTLAEHVGSGMISQAQLQNASIGNVLTLFDFRGGSETDRLEMGYLMQRFIIEGYIRGVDVYKFMQDTARADGARMVVGLMTEDEMKKLYNPGGAAALAGGSGVNAILNGWSDKANYTLFTDGYWRDSSDLEKFGMFFHEFGHQLGLPHAGDGGYKPSGGVNFMGSSPEFNNEGLDPGQHMHFSGEEPWYPFTKRFQTQMIDSLFKDARNQTMGAPLTRFSPKADQAIPTTPPQGFPQIGGADQNNITVVQKERNVYNIRPTSISPSSPTPMGLESGGVADLSTPEAMDKTPVAGMLPNMPSVSSFAAGVDEVMNRASPMLNNMAGSILRRKG